MSPGRGKECVLDKSFMTPLLILEEPKTPHRSTRQR